MANQQQVVARTARQAREATGLTQREFAKLIGANHITVSKWENGARRPSQVAQRLLGLIAAGPELCLDVLRKSMAREHRRSTAAAGKRAAARRSPRSGGRKA